MRHVRFTLISMLLLAGCAGSGDRASTLRQGLTNVVNEDEIPYVTNGDEFADAQAKIPVPGQPVQKKIVKDSLADRIREYEFTRWDDASTDKKKATRFGTNHWELNVLFRKQRTVKLTGTFGKSAAGTTTLVPSGRASRYVISESVLKDEFKPYEKTRLHFKLTDSRKKDSIVVSYYAFLGTFEAREDEANKPAPGSVFECQLKALHERTLAWVNNWTTIGGRVFFYNDLVHTGNVKDTEDCLPSQISIRGESLATSIPKTDAQDPVEDGETLEHRMESNLGEVNLIGNSPQGNRRMFMASLGEKNSTKKNDVVLTVVPQDAADNDVATDDQYDENGNPIAATPDQSAPTRSTPPSRATPAAPRRPAPAPPARPGDAYLSTTAGPQAARQVRDFEQNRNLRGVVDAMNAFRGQRKAQLQRFFDNAAPFRPMMEAISQAYDVIGWAYLTVVESKYFTEPGYPARIRGDKVDGVMLAWGPFQMHKEAAVKPGGMRVTNREPSDERDYFAPEACGAAAYVAEHVQTYPNDATVAILAYNQGAGGMAARIYCGYHPDQAGRQRQCVDNVKRASRAQRGQYIRLAKSFRYTYAAMTKFSVLTDDNMKYVSNKLALYFIALNPTAYGFTMNTGKRSLPTNGTVLPPGGVMNNQFCQQRIKGTY